MSEQANAPRVWMRWALALAMATGTVAGSIVPAFAQDDQAAAGAPAEQPSDDQTFEQIVAGNLSEATGQEIVAAEPAPEQAPAEQPAADQAPADQAPIEQAPAEEAPAESAPVEQAPAQQDFTEQAPVEAAPVEEAPAEQV